MPNLLEKVSSLARRRGFIYPGSSIYGGLAGIWDYGPLGVELKRNIRKEFWRTTVENRDDVVGVESSILMHSKVWEASGHVASFVDPLVECKSCHKRFRLDEIKDKCLECGGSLTEPKKFNLLVETYLGVVEGEKQKTYLRGEITQGVHVNFKNVLDSSRVKIPFGIAQIGKAFRNEITPSQLTFRSREFEQMELQFYIKSQESEAKKWLDYWKEERFNWYLALGLKRENLRLREHRADELAHYAKQAFDIEYNLDGEWRELEGIHNRTDWDLRRHQEFSKVDLSYFDEELKDRYLPWIIETSGGVDRAALFFLVDAYHEERVKTSNEIRTVLKLNPRLAPYKVAVFPLLANKEKLVEKAREVYSLLKIQDSLLPVVWDDRGNIGKRYYSQDEIGTPYCITVDFESLQKKDVTVRNRDSMKQERVKIKELKAYLEKKLTK